MLTHRTPHELPLKGLGIDFRSKVNISQSFANWLEKILEPIVEERFPSANDAILALDNKVAIAYVPATFRKPEKSRINLKIRSNNLYIKIPYQSLEIASIHDETLEINPQKFKLKSRKPNLFVIPQEYEYQGNTADIDWISLIGGKGIKNTVIIAVWENGNKTHHNFGKGLINQQEAKWLAREISAFLEQIRS